MADFDHEETLTAMAKDQRTGGLSETPWTYDHLSGWVEAGPNELPLARVYGSDADGRLIAKAPDLEAILRAIREIAHDYGDGAPDSTPAAKAMTRIAAMATEVLGYD